MALKRKLTKAEYDKLKPEVKEEYIADGDGFKLDLDGGDEDTGPLKRALEREKAAAGTSKARVAELETQLEELSNNDAKKKGDIATLERQWQKKIDEQKAAFEAKDQRLSAHLTKTLVDNVANQLASKLSDKAPKLLLPHIKARLKADLDGDEPVTKVLDANGKESALTLDQLHAEFVANKDFSAIITASKASGGAASPQNKGGGAPAFNSDNKPADLSKMNARDLAAHIQANKANQE